MVGYSFGDDRTGGVAAAEAEKEKRRVAGIAKQERCIDHSGKNRTEAIRHILAQLLNGSGVFDVVSMPNKSSGSVLKKTFLH